MAEAKCEGPVGDGCDLAAEQERAEAFHPLDGEAQALSGKIVAAPVVSREGGLGRQRAGQASLVKRHARNHADVVGLTQGQQRLGWLLIEHVVDDLDGLDLT